MRDIFWIVILGVAAVSWLVVGVIGTDIVQHDPDGNCVAVIFADGREGQCGMLPDRYMVEHVGYKEAGQ